MDNTQKTSVAEIYARYTYARMKEAAKFTSREKLGQALNHIFNYPELRTLTVDNVQGNWYKGIVFKEEAKPIQNIDEIVLPEYAHAEYRAPHFILELVTRYEVDEVPLKFVIDLDTNTNQYVMMVNGYAVDPVTEYGFTGYGRLTQNWISGMALACREMYFCKGMNIMVRPDSRVMIARSWKDTHQLFSPEEQRWHSKKCKVLLSVTKNAKTEACRKCSHDLR